jgi:sphingomyelin phosphodiesterase
MLNRLAPLFLLLLLVPSLRAVNPICVLCHEVARAIQHAVPLQPPVILADVIGTTVCARQHMQQKNVCKGAVSEMVPLMINNAWKHYSDPHLVCSDLKLCPQEYAKRNLNNDMAKIL